MLEKQLDQDIEFTRSRTQSMSEKPRRDPYEVVIWNLSKEYFIMMTSAIKLNHLGP
jgi:hypothetical protein